MSSYVFRKTIRVEVVSETGTASAKIRFMADNDDWVKIAEPIILPFSIHSLFHEGIKGKLKVKAFLTVIKEYAKGKRTILVADRIHANALSLKYGGDHHKALQKCCADAQLLKKSLESFFAEFEITDCQNFSQDDDLKKKYSIEVQDFYQNDSVFRKLVAEDAKYTYTSTRAAEYPDETLYLNQTAKDILEQATYLYYFRKNKYRFELYPGKPYSSVNYLNSLLSKNIVPFTQVHVNISIDSFSSYA